MRRSVHKRRRKSRTLKKIRNGLIYWLVRLLVLLGSAIPLQWGLCLGAAFGRVAFVLGRSMRRRMLVHLRVAFPEKDEAWRVDVARRTLMNLGRGFFELLHFSEILDGVDGKGRWVGYLQVEDVEHMADQIAGGRGGLFVTGHCGNWELMAAYTVRLGFPVSTVVRDLYDPRLAGFLNRHRERFGYHPILREDKALARAILRVFRNNEFMGLLMDQDTKVRGAFVPFFGHLAHTPTGPAQIAYQANMDALTAFIHRRPEGGHKLVVGPPVSRPQTGDLQADIREYTAILTKAIEENIRRHPDEWVWMHRRWEKRPEDEPPEENPLSSLE